MSTTSRQPTGWAGPSASVIQEGPSCTVRQVLRCDRSTVVGAGCAPASESRRPCARRPPSRPRACTRTMCAPSSTAAVTAAAVPHSRSSAVALADRRFQKRLARRADQQRADRAARSSGRPASSARLCSARLAKPIPGSTITRSRAMPAASARAQRARRSSAATSPTTSTVAARRDTSRATARGCASASPRRPRRATTGARPGSYLSALMSLTMAAPRSRAASATLRLVGVDRDRHAQAPGQALEDRLDARALLVGASGLGAGPRGFAADVDRCRRRPPPSRSAASTARDGSTNRPPSAKESGVTLRTPITEVRAPRSSGARPAADNVAPRGEHERGEGRSE